MDKVKKRKKPKSQRSKKSNTNTKVWEKFMAWCNFAIAFFTAGLFGIGAISACFLYGQLREMQIDQRTDQRAWVVPFDFSSTQNKLHQTYFEVRYKNIGKTPALETRIRVVIVDHTKEEGLDVEPIESNENAVLPTDVTFVCKSKPYIGNVLKSINEGRIPLLFGTIWYKDIFGQRHRTKFCYSIGEDFSLAPMGPHNKMEDDDQK